MINTFPLTSGLPVLQGWWAPGTLDLSAAFHRAGGWALIRAEAFPDPEIFRARLQARLEAWKGEGHLGLDLRGLRMGAEHVLAAAREAGVAFVLHTQEMDTSALRQCALPRISVVRTVEEARAAQADGASALLTQAEAVEAMASMGLPVMATVDTPEELRRALRAGASALQPRHPGLLGDASLRSFNDRLMGTLPAQGRADLLENAAPLPRLRIRNLDLPYPIVQGGMGVGVSWERLAGAVASEGCVGLVSAIGTGYHRSAPERPPGRRPVGAAALNPPDVLEGIVREARRRSGGRGAVGVNILCAIEGYEEAVRASVAGGAQLIVSGAGLPLGLPGMVGDADVALVPIVSSARALAVICRQWSRKFNRLPDAVVLEGPESGGHQGVAAEACGLPEHRLEALLPDVLAERDRWGSFPVLVAGGVWDRADIDRFLAMGASGVQMATRFIGTFECDAHQAFKDTILRAGAEDIVLMKSPVGMPARGVHSALHRSIEAGTAPSIACVSQCLQPCGHGKGAREAGFCIADRLADAWRGQEESGLFFCGSNGARLKEIVSVRDLIEELTQDPGLSRNHGN